MPGQRRFGILVFICVVIILSLWYHPIQHAQHDGITPPIRSHDNLGVQIGAGPLLTTSPTSTSREIPFAHAVQDTPSNAVAATQLSSTKQELQLSTVAHRTSLLASSAAVANLDTTSIDLFAYLQESPAPDPFAYLGSSSGYTAQQETETQNEYAYLSASTSIDEYVYLTVASTAAPTHTARVSQASAASQVSHARPAASGDTDVSESDNFAKDDYWFFQDDLSDFPLPKYNIEKLKGYSAHNYDGPGHETYATFLSTRNNSMQDPYFLATLQQAYRILWDPRSKSGRHPFTVFVAPYIPYIQRDILAASGALVRELGLIPWQPSHASKAAPRWKDMFSKLNFWNQTDFTRILYLDTDAFPLENVDQLFTMPEKQSCAASKLPDEEQLVQSRVCDYTFMAAHDTNNEGLNAGMIVLQPNTAMHAYLLRESQNPDNFDQDFAEQAFLNYAFREGGPFPAQLIDRKWNAIFTEPEDENNIKIIHEKLWAMWFRPEHFAHTYFRDTWNDMLKLYESTEFSNMRAADDRGK